MADTPNAFKLPALETPPRTTGNAQMDIPILVDWFYKAYLAISRAIAFINGQVAANPDITITDLPNPSNSTVAQAQTTANEAYILATVLKQDIQKGQVFGTFTITDAADSATVTLDADQPDANYRAIIQAVSVTGAPDPSSYNVKSKSYGTGSFSVTLVTAPGVGNSVTFEWQMIRNL